jgi:hypothetical protein
MNIRNLQVIFEIFDKVKALCFSSQIIQFIYRDIIQGTIFVVFHFSSANYHSTNVSYTYKPSIITT